MALIGLLIYGAPFYLVPVVVMLFLSSLYGKKSGDGSKTRAHYIAKLSAISIAVTFVNTPFAGVIFSWALGSFQPINTAGGIGDFFIETLKETTSFALVIALLISPVWLLTFFWAETNSDKFEERTTSK